MGGWKRLLISPERCPDQRSTHRDGYRERLLTTQVGDLTLAIPKLRKGSFFPNWLEPCRRGERHSPSKR